MYLAAWTASSSVAGCRDIPPELGQKRWPKIYPKKF